jgi:hypothetical protein
MSIGVCWRVKDWNPLLSEQSTGPGWFEEQWKILEGIDNGDPWRISHVVETDLENGMLKSQSVATKVSIWGSGVHLWTWHNADPMPILETGPIQLHIQSQLCQDLPGLLDGSTL